MGPCGRGAAEADGFGSEACASGPVAGLAGHVRWTRVPLFLSVEHMMNRQHFELLEQARRALPGGFKVELSGDTIVMQASPSAMHQLNLSKIHGQFDAHVPEGYVFTGNTDLVSPQTAKVRNPDLTYLPEEAMTTTDSSVAAELALIAVEVVSPSSPENDWVGKLRDYPLMGVPLYLVVDARQKVVTLFSEVENGRYRLREDADFGEGVHIPEPFAFVFDTGVLRPYG